MRRCGDAEMRSEKLYPNSDTCKEKILSENQNKSGIYMWKNRINGKQYIGSSIDLLLDFCLRQHILILIIYAAGSFRSQSEILVCKFVMLYLNMVIVIFLCPHKIMSTISQKKKKMVLHLLAVNITMKLKQYCLTLRKGRIILYTIR